MSVEQKTYIITKDYTVSNKEFSLQYDEETDILYTSPKPELQSLSKYYDSPSYISHTDNHKGLFNQMYQQVKKLALHHKVKLIRKWNKNGGVLLDIGAGTGDFLVEAKKKGWNVQGIEPNVVARENALKKEITLHTAYTSFKERSFDVITMWHVLEHIYNLDNQINLISTYLKKEGTLIIAVPNYKSFDANYYKEFWAAYDVPRHLWHFSKKSISIIFEKYGFEVQKVKPMWFDSFYVSILSEKYKNSKIALLKGLGIGLYSNVEAKWKTKEFSSQIYILKRMKSKNKPI
ncbi:class I SAM-dependent methyltransferase [Aquimarina sp. ERC-38]|uniref:class I SAM-dependent methyltransferase n=1 Tax=Aquimarina sp. ERC-38 TaxID=2949996 RepID=UPI00224574B9|nr:class I SAM-dependent methyltransferase [Aquimarina sp. ERC-38]UZO81842.1 class I SAM-dependent methyltransferase [Aquimarina sp. ERC-38]